MIPARYVHTNLIARDADRLIRFYAEVFGCTPVPPARDLAGKWLDRATGIAGAKLRGQHLRLPGGGNDGPTLEIFEYDPGLPHEPGPPNRPGWGHVAFAVQDVAAARKAVLDAGGTAVGELVTTDVPDAGGLTFIYMRDPEGNIIELQSWEAVSG